MTTEQLSLKIEAEKGTFHCCYPLCVQCGLTAKINCILWINGFVYGFESKGLLVVGEVDTDGLGAKI